MRTLVVDGTFFLSSGIPRGGRGGILKIITLGHGSSSSSSNMDSEAGKETFVVAPSSAAGSSSKADAWREFEWKLLCVLIFQTETELYTD